MDESANEQTQNWWQRIVSLFRRCSACIFRAVSLESLSTPPADTPDQNESMPEPRNQYSSSEAYSSSSSHAITTPSTLEIIRPQPPAKYLIPAPNSKPSADISGPEFEGQENQSKERHSNSSQDTAEQVQSLLSWCNASIGSESKHMQETALPQGQPQSPVAKTEAKCSSREKSKVPHSWPHFIPLYKIDRRYSEPSVREPLPPEGFTRQPLSQISLQELVISGTVYLDDIEPSKTEPLCLLKASELAETLQLTMHSQSASASTSESATSSKSAPSSGSGLSLRLTVALHQPSNPLDEPKLEEGVVQHQEVAPSSSSNSDSAQKSISPEFPASPINETSSSGIELSNVVRNLLLISLNSQEPSSPPEVGEKEKLIASSQGKKKPHDSAASITSDQSSLEEDPPPRLVSFPLPSGSPSPAQTEQNLYGEGPSGLLTTRKQLGANDTTTKISTSTESSSSLVSVSPLSSPEKIKFQKEMDIRRMQNTPGIPTDDQLVASLPGAIPKPQEHPLNTQKAKPDNAHANTSNEEHEFDGEIIYIDILLERIQPGQPEQQSASQPGNIPVIEEREGRIRPPTNIAQLRRLVPHILYAELIVESRQPSHPEQNQSGNIPATGAVGGRESPIRQFPHIDQIRQPVHIGPNPEARSADVQPHANVNHPASMHPASMHPSANVNVPAYGYQPANMQQPIDRHQPLNVHAPVGHPRVNVNPPGYMYPLANIRLPTVGYPPGNLNPPANIPHPANIYPPASRHDDPNMQHANINPLANMYPPANIHPFPQVVQERPYVPIVQRIWNFPRRLPRPPGPPRILPSLSREPVRLLPVNGSAANPDEEVPVNA